VAVAVRYEYAIKLALTGVVVYPNLTEQQAYGLLATLRSRGAKHDTFRLMRRCIGEWEDIESAYDPITINQYDWSDLE
jgi:hypothetical protein